MRKVTYILSIISFFEYNSFAGNGTDSLVLFSDLNYHSEFEKEVIYNFVKHGTDTFNLFLAIDENMTSEKADRLYNVYLKVLDELYEKKISSKKIDKQVQAAYRIIQDHFFKEYNTDEYFPVMLESGAYNCVSASMMFSLVFDRLGIPYKVMASPERVYLISNPGQDSIIVEAKNPSYEKNVFTDKFKQQYVYYLHSSGLINESDYKNRSFVELFEQYYYQVREVGLYNLPGFQYYNKAIYNLLNKEKKDAYELCQKAWFFYQGQQVKTLLYTSLLPLMEQCSFDKVSDIDYLACLSRFENVGLNTINGIFNNILADYLQRTDKKEYCDSLYRRLVSQISDKSYLDEISFSYYLQMGYHYRNTDKMEHYVANALRIKEDNHDAIVMMENHLRVKLNNINNSYALLDTVLVMKKKYDFAPILPILEEYQAIAYLRIAGELSLQKDIKSGEEYLEQFENICKIPFTNQMIGYWVEKTYRSFAVYYFYKNDKAKAGSFVERGLKYVPGSELLKSAVY